MSDETSTVSPYHNLPERLTAYADAEEALGSYTEAKALYAAAVYIKRLEDIVKHLRPNQNNMYFICGATEIDETGTPERVMICPAMGADPVYVYERFATG